MPHLVFDFDMGKYGVFVWPAWAISALVLGWMVFDTVQRARRAKAELKRLDPDEPA
jgi:heme exporter protein D